MAKAAQLVGTALPGPGGIVAKIIGIAASSALAFAKAGKDPVAEIQRIHSSDPLVAGVHDGWNDLIKDRFGPREPVPPPPVPPPPDTHPSPSTDPYDDEENTS
ncbi:MAG: hypothetical protein ACYTF5_21830 [Planctomycetota bacterium]